MKKQILTLTTTLASLAVMALPATQPAGFLKAGSKTTHAPLKLETGTTSRSSVLLPKTFKKAPSPSDRMFSYKTAIPRQGGIHRASIKGATNYSMPAYGVVVYSDSWLEDKPAISACMRCPPTARHHRCIL